MKPIFIQYPVCETCRKAKKWMRTHQIEYTDRLITEQRPTAAELNEWIPKSGLPLKKFFNTSGNLYKELELKNKLPNMTEAEQISILASNGKLIKRPLLITTNKVLVGFNKQEWETALK